MVETFGARLRVARQRSGVSVTRLSEILKLTHQAYYKWETDESRPDIREVPTLCKMLGCDPNFLYDFEDKSHRWSQPAIRSANIITELPDQDQKVLLYMATAIKLQVTTKEIALSAPDISDLNL